MLIMTGCSAPNCTNHSRNGYKFYRFPADPERRKKWLINCRRRDWNPTQNSRLCSAHFDESQIEQRRADGRKLLLPFAVPTIFNVSNPPKLLNVSRKSAYKRPREQRKLNNTDTPKCIKLDELCATDTTSLSLTSLSDTASTSLVENGEAERLTNLNISLNGQKVEQLTVNTLTDSQCKTVNQIVASTIEVAGVSSFENDDNENEADQLTENAKRCRVYRQRKKLNQMAGKRVNKNEGDQPTLNAIRCRRYRQRKKLNTTVIDTRLLLAKEKQIHENGADQSGHDNTLGDSESLLKKLLLNKGKQVQVNNDEVRKNRLMLNAKRCRAYRERKKLKGIVFLANSSVTTAVDSELPLKKEKCDGVVNEADSLESISDDMIKLDKKGANYNYQCFVPSCQSTSLDSKKIFIPVPKVEDIREAWSVVAGLREVPSSSADIYCCEDHFIMKQDCENWIAYNIYQAELKMKQDVVPHRNLSRLSDVSRDFSQRSTAAEKKKGKIKEGSSTIISTKLGTNSSSFLDKPSMSGLLHQSFANKSVQANFEMAKSSVSIGVNTT